MQAGGGSAGVAYHFRMKRLLLAALLLAVAPSASAWGSLGHRLVASLASDDLSPATRREIALLLEGEKDPTLAGVSTWADELRANDPGLGRRSSPWHYVNLAEDGCAYDAARDCKGGDCIVEAIRRQAAILADRSRPIEERRRALKFVVHFVGDVHQPMHAGFARDKGGNTVQIRVRGRNGERGTNLHSYWDSGMLEAAGLGESAYLARLRAMPLAVALDRNPLPPAAGAWAMQSCRIATTHGVYPKGPRLAQGYDTRWRPVAEIQLRRAGARLAHVLNGALGA